MKKNKLLKKLNSFSYVSFDIFDTLIKRDVKNPHDVFKIVEIEYNSLYNRHLKNFKEDRIKAELKARENTSKEEITFDDIYQNFSSNYKKEALEKLKKLEIEVEKNLCIPCKNMIDIFNKIKKEKHVIITSDMYLDEKVIKDILIKNKITGYEKLYLSSSFMATKQTGNLYEIIKKDLNIKRKDLIHIGDNIFSDYLMAKIKGFKSFLLKNDYYNNYYNKKIPNKFQEDYKSLEHFISNHLEENDYYYNMGYETFGPILYGFSKWLQENNKNTNLYFLARDGYILQKSYNILNNDKTKYLYASRRALIIPTLWKYDNLKDMTNNFVMKLYVRIKDLFEMLGLEEKEFSKIVLKHHYNLNDVISYEDIFKNSNFAELTKELIPLIKKNSLKEYNILKSYLNQEKFKGKVSIVDIGWNGNMQKSLNSLNLGLDITGFYVGVSPDSKNLGFQKMKGFLFDDKNNYEISLFLKSITAIFESMFLAPHGSTKKYQFYENKVEPVLKPYEYENSFEKDVYFKIQKGALDFVKDFHSSKIKEIINLSPVVCIASLKKFAYYPKLKDVEKFGDCKFVDEKEIYIAKPHKISYYLIHPRNLFKDIYASGWIIGFMKRLTKINFFYPQIFNLYLKIYMRKKEKLFK